MSQVPNTSETTAAEPAAIRQLIASGAHKRAVERAKTHLQACPGEDAERLLADAYIARALAFDPRLVAEAHAVIDLVAARCPSQRGRLEDVRRIVAVRCGRLEGVVAPLAEEGASAEAVEAAARLLCRELTDLGALARCATLPEGHPLRAAAAALDRAFRAATSGPVSDGDVALDEVSRRSPLSPWKLLVRAVVAFHRRDDEACERHLSALPPDCAPARLVPVLRAMVHGGDLPDAAARLRDRVGAGTSELREALVRLDRALEGGKPREALREVREAVERCRSSRRDLLDTLRQRISIRCALRKDLDAERVRAAMGGPAPRDSGFWRLRALAAEEQGDLVLATASWEIFRRCAVSEGLLDEREAAAVTLRMADTLGGLSPEHLARARARLDGVRQQLESEPEETREEVRSAVAALESGFDPGGLYRGAAQRDPRPEVFRRWLAWARRLRGWKWADEAATAWHEALPDDTAPLLFLVESAEERGSFNKALAFLEMAEARDRLDPEVGRARARLLVALVRRHLSKGKTALAERAVDELAELPWARSDRGTAFVLSLRWAASVPDAREAWRVELASVCGGPARAAVLLQAVAAACGLRWEGPPPPEAGLAEAVGAACALGDEFGLPLPILEGWAKPLFRQLPSERLDAAALRALAGAALRSGRKELAHAAAGCGLALTERSLDAAFLLMRGRSLPPWTPRRVRECLVAAAELARRSRDTALLAEIVAADPLGTVRSPALLSLEDAVPEETLRRILRRERSAGAYPVFERDREEPIVTGCDCPVCRGASRPAGLEEGDDPFCGDLEDDRPEGLEEGFEDLEALPPEVLALFLEAAAKYGRYGRLPSPDEIRRKDPKLFERMESALIESVAGGGPPPQSGRARKKRRWR